MVPREDEMAGRTKSKYEEKETAELTRTGVSIEEALLKQFDRLIARRGYQNRSEGLRDLVRESLVAEAIDQNEPVVATLSNRRPVTYPLMSELKRKPYSPDSESSLSAVPGVAPELHTVNGPEDCWRQSSPHLGSTGS
jgi:Arc/MetJ-type ribon-helix-helix transcriptional regulator